MLGCGSGAQTPAYNQLQPFELFVLLTAILLHDAGNAIGREEHEGAAASILNEIAAGTTLGSVERRLIASIARAHGGKLSNGDKDTIPALITEPLSNIHGARVHGRRLAALLRLGDELSEGPTRADSVAIKGGPDVPAESVLANKFCRDINVDIDYVGHSFELSFQVDVTELTEQYSIKKDSETKDIYFVDFIRDRLEKCEAERRYCNRYLSGFASYDRMRVKLFIFQQDQQVGQLSLVLEERGYPQVKPSVRAEEQDFDGHRLCLKYCETEAAQ
jgi:exopolyphosphatase/pppGpp-phosphohydrolase